VLSDDAWDVDAGFFQSFFDFFFDAGCYYCCLRHVNTMHTKSIQAYKLS